MPVSTKGAASTGVREDAPADEPWLPPPTFQNITLEESRHSFVKQFGRFAFHDADEGPTDRAWASNAKAYAFVSGTGEFVVGGDATYGGAPAPLLLAYFLRNPPLRLYSTEKAFAALVPMGDDNRLIAWGADMQASASHDPLSGIRAVYANRHAFAFIYSSQLPSSQWIGALGPGANGGVIPDQIHLQLADDEPLSIRATEDAFAVLTRRGKVHVWGNAANGGALSPEATALLERTTVKKLFATSKAFCALGENGEPIAWGAPNQGGNLSASNLADILDDGGAETIVAAQQAFCCVTRGRRKGVAWGHAQYGGTVTDSAAGVLLRGGIVACKAATCAFCAVADTGAIAAWGYPTYGGALPPGLSLASSSILSAAGSAQTTVSAASSLAAMGTLGMRFTSSEWTASLFSNDFGFALFTFLPDNRIRSVSTWGATSVVVPDVTKQVLLGSYLQGIRTSNGGWLAIVRQGQTSGCSVAWGDPTRNGGAIPADIISRLHGEVVDARATTSLPIPGSSGSSGFVVWTSAGESAGWGGTAAPFYRDA